MEFLALAEKFVSAIERADVDVIRQCYASDARIWHNFDNIEQTVDQNLATLAWMVKRLPERRYVVLRREALSDGFMQQHILAGTARNGESVSMPACIICKVADGRITRLDEYLDPTGAAALNR